MKFHVDNLCMLPVGVLKMCFMQVGIFGECSIYRGDSAEISAESLVLFSLNLEKRLNF